MKYWEIIKAFEEGKTLECVDKGVWNVKDFEVERVISLLGITNPEDWTIAKSDYEKALEIVKSSKLESDFNLYPYEMKEVANLMVKFKNGEV